MLTKHKMPANCPICSGDLYPTEMTCSGCGTQIRSDFQECSFCRLSPEQLQFAVIFLGSRGNLSAVGDELDISYPTVARRLEAVLSALAGSGAAAAPAPVTSGKASPAAELAGPAKSAVDARSDDERARERREILEMLDRGEITAEQATRQLKDL